MKRILLYVISLAVSIVAFGQLRPPSQRDTFYIKSVKYMGEIVRPENWPAKIIVRCADTLSIAGYDYVLSKPNYRYDSFQSI